MFECPNIEKTPERAIMTNRQHPNVLIVILLLASGLLQITPINGTPDSRPSFIFEIPHSQMEENFRGAPFHDLVISCLAEQPESATVTFKLRAGCSKQDQCWPGVADEDVTVTCLHPRRAEPTIDMMSIILSDLSIEANGERLQKNEFLRRLRRHREMHPALLSLSTVPIFVLSVTYPCSIRTYFEFLQTLEEEEIGPGILQVFSVCASLPFTGCRTRDEGLFYYKYFRVVLHSYQNIPARASELNDLRKTQSKIEKELNLQPEEKEQIEIQAGIRKPSKVEKEIPETE